ncbi:glycosyl hydrolase, partial [Vibrio fortis]
MHKYAKGPSLAGLDISSYSTDELRELVSKLLNRKIHGISFSPYVSGQSPGSLLTEEQIRERLSIIRPYVKWIRTFSCTDGNELIPKIAHEMGLKTLVGVWLDDDLEMNDAELTNAIQLAEAGYVDMLGVGNEVLLRGELSAELLVGYIERAKRALPNIDVGYVDAYYLFELNPEVTDACDVVFANCYPFWEGVPIEHSLVYMRDMYQRVFKVSGGKKVVVSETGWPNEGPSEHGAVPSWENAIR